MRTGDRPVAPTRLVFPTLETDAERAWRYGKEGVGYRYVGGYWLFPDGSSIWRRWQVHTPRSHRRIVEITHGMAAREYPDWSAA